MSRKAEYDNTGAEDPRHEDIPEWLEEALEGKSRREQDRILKSYRAERGIHLENPRDAIRVEVLKPSGHLRVSSVINGKREWIRYAGLSREEAVNDFKEVFKLRGRTGSSTSRRNPYVESGAYIIPDNDINRQASKMG